MPLIKPKPKDEKQQIRIAISKDILEEIKKI